MDVAIKYDKINLGNEKYVFKPVGIIKGKYDEATETFETEYGELCAPIDGDSQFEDNYFGLYISMEDLKKGYEGKNLNEEEMLTEYFDENIMYYCLGQFDYVENKMQVVYIPYESFEEVYDTPEEEYEPTEKGVKITFTIEKLKELREIDDIEKIREQFDSILLCAKTIEDNNNASIAPQASKVQESAFILEKEESKLLSLKELRDEVKAVIKGQDKAVDAVTRAVIVNQMSSNPRHKSHMLITGPSGTGKTEMINIISKKLGIPYFKADATAYTKEGYVGKSVYSMLNGLITAAGNDLNKAEHGILIIDEIDKKLSSRSDDVGGTDVLNSMLKMMDRDLIEVDIGHGMSDRKVMFDTSNLTIIFMGAFASLYKEKEEEKKQSKKTIGFSFELSEADPKTKNGKKEKISITNDDLIKAGIPPEFLGRIPIVTSTEELELEDLVEILYKSKGGAIEEEKEFFEDMGITITFTSEYMKEIAKKAQETKTGARNLRKLVRESLAVVYDDVLSGKEIKVLKLTKATANDPKKYYAE